MNGLMLAVLGLVLALLAAIPFTPSNVRRSLAILALLTAVMGALPLLFATEHSREVNLAIYLALLGMFWLAGRFEAK